MLLNEKSNLTDREVIEKGSRVLIKELGHSGFLRFIRGHQGRSPGTGSGRSPGTGSDDHRLLPIQKN